MGVWIGDLGIAMALDHCQVRPTPQTDSVADTIPRFDGHQGPGQEGDQLLLPAAFGKHED